jgi:hypothetical protein
MVKEMPVEYLAAVAAKKVASKEKKVATFEIFPPYVPPRGGTYSTAYGKIKVQVWLDKERGRWMARVKFLDTELSNPVIPPAQGRQLLEKLKK